MLTRPDRLLRLEALMALMASLVVYSVVLHGHWTLFAIFFLTPDLALLGYLGRNSLHFAAAAYNAAHTYAFPVILGLAAWRWTAPHASQFALIWIAHIAFDRLLGFGLKYPQAFKPTHIQIAEALIIR